VDQAVYDHLFQLYHRRRDADFTAVTFDKDKVGEYARNFLF
jgi:hypothetical protein